MLALRCIGSSSSPYCVAPITSPSTSITNVFSSATNASISPSSRIPHRRTISGSSRIAVRRATSPPRVAFRRTTRRPRRITALRPDVLVQAEHVVGVEGPLQLDQPFVLRVPVDRARDIGPGLDDVVHVVALRGERG